MARVMRITEPRTTRQTELAKNMLWPDKKEDLDVDKDENTDNKLEQRQK